jgi:hypothetical protein
VLRDQRHHDHEGADVKDQLRDVEALWVAVGHHLPAQQHEEGDDDAE